MDEGSSLLELNGAERASGIGDGLVRRLCRSIWILSSTKNLGKPKTCGEDAGSDAGVASSAGYPVSEH